MVVMAQSPSGNLACKRLGYAVHRAAIDGLSSGIAFRFKN
jgi:hypothetical protein